MSPAEASPQLACLSVVLVGSESVGKTSLFRRITSDSQAFEANFRGSTVFCRTSSIAGHSVILTDTPGLRPDTDSVTTQLALDAYERGDVIGLTVKVTDLRTELSMLCSQLDLHGRRAFLILTHCDRDPDTARTIATTLQSALGIPVVPLNARKLEAHHRSDFFRAAEEARSFDTSRAGQIRWGELPGIRFSGGALLRENIFTQGAALLGTFALFGLPVYLSYRIADWLQPWVDSAWMQPLADSLGGIPPWIHEAAFGSYGFVSLGWYSFLWAFPTVLLVGLFLAIAEETGFVEVLAQLLDPPLRKIGMSGRDLIPVLTGFGCNVVAVFQSRSCSQCQRSACVSMISFASACSYQIGASLSIFNSSRHPGLFIPYLILLFFAGALHTRYWHRDSSSRRSFVHRPRIQLQRPTWSGVFFRLRSVVDQFIRKAMPAFLVICVAATALKQTGIVDLLSRTLERPLRWTGLPAEGAPSILFSILRKDGLLILNQNHGDLLASLPVGSIFLLVFLASTLSPCLVTLLTIGKEMGAREASKVAYRQALTSVTVTVLLAAFLRVSGAA